MSRQKSSPSILYDAAQARALDRYTIDELNVSAIALMTRAGEAAFRFLKAHWRNIQHIVLVCGGGNNAGDAYVLAKLLHTNNYRVSVIQVGDTTKLSDTAQTCLRAMREAGVEPDGEWSSLEQAELIVDALFGVGLDRHVSGKFNQAIQLINKALCPVLSLDVPSGLNATTGQVMGVAVVASATVSFMTAKIGLYTGAGPDHAGIVLNDDLGTPAIAYEHVPPVARGLTHRNVKHLLGARSRTGHKGNHGHALIIGGGFGYRGALLLAGEAAARSGAGLVTLIGYADGPELINPERPELMFRGIDKPQQMNELLHRSSVIAIGPGLGTDEAASARFSAVLQSDKPLVVDADALRLLAAEPFKRDHWILTPHPGEAAALLDCSVSEVQADRLSAARDIVNRYGGSVILKGAGSIVFSGGVAEVLMHGNPGMGSGGMGDVLTGLVAGLIAQGLSCQAATRLGACIHARAADRAALAGERGLLARDLMPHIRQLVN